MTLSIFRCCRLAAVAAAMVLVNGSALGPAPIPARGGADLFVLDIAGTPVGEMPAGIKLLNGILEVVMKNGVPMLKASARSEFLITLPQLLPQDVTFTFDVMPKLCCNPQDLSFEGTPLINQGAASAHIMWDSDGSLQVVGGGAPYDTPMPKEFQPLPGVLARVVVVLQGTTVRMYTNGRRLYTLERRFVRGRVLRVFLGGQDGGEYAVHLAGLRITAGAGETGIIAAQAGLPVRAQTPAPQVPIRTEPPPPPAPTEEAQTPPATLVPRTITLPGFSGLGGFATLTSRTITLPGFSGLGGFATLTPRTITLPGFSGLGGFATLTPRTITLPGWTAVGGTPNPERTQP